MKAFPAQLQGLLQKGFAPIYLVHGDEPLQLRDALDLVRSTTREQGYDERLVFDISASFDWNSLQLEASSMSLFASQRLIELRMPSGKPGKEGGRVLKEMAENPTEGTILLISSEKLEAATQRTAWYKAIEKQGLIIQARQLNLQQLLDWIRQQAGQLGLSVDNEAARLLAEKSEGNMLACQQELQKLQMLSPAGTIGLDEMLNSVFDNARYNVFSLVDTALSGDGRRTQRILRHLQQEGVQPSLIVWALAREVRTLASMATQLASGQPLSAILARHRIWDNRKALVGDALRRLASGHIHRLLYELGQLDQIVKGQIREKDFWNEVTRTGLRLAGTTI